MAQKETENWVSRYAAGYHAWKTDQINGKKVYRRPLGLVEFSFDTDGTDYGGRADINALLTLEVRHALSENEFSRRICLAWTNLRLQHTMLMTRICENKETGKREFVVTVEGSKVDAIQEATKTIVWVADHYTSVDGIELYRHCQNVARIIDPASCLSHLFVLPPVQRSNGNFEVQFLIIMAHEISDGLTSYNWFSHFIRILNTPVSIIEQEIEIFGSAENIASRLLPAQEDLYPPIAGSKARQRWFWAIMRALRHVQKIPPQAFINPLLRTQRMPEPMSFPPTFSKLFDYSKENKPPMNSFHCVASLSKPASSRLIQLCRSNNISVGAGCFALAGISMMEIEEARRPNVPASERRPFAASFPLNPRTFFGWTSPADSCMLAFSDGIVIPFLPSSLPVEGRFKLIARQANRQLRMYQKRLKSGEVNNTLDHHSPGRILANGYLYMFERVEAKLPAHRKTGINPQGGYPAKMAQTKATCGVSSVGSTASYFRPGAYDLNDVGTVQGKDFAADYRSLRMGVRARENEFLAGSSTDANGIVGFGVSYDGNAISEESAEAWAEKIKSLLEIKEDKAKL
ncbi:hypothetical protein CC78DRAFT_528404 [Lojkania enalia]|uniref:Uncharacterized protein n=1 Tax=Lojkania enalia TaxID=147567 RepID=A0A9P4NCE7_9PLEO|nr:hypothetical protein CC78DRAFT_528404 [Didymosphaeria enalia]